MSTLDYIIDCIVNFYIVVASAVIIIGNAVKFILYVKCRKEVICTNEKCFYKEYCKKYSMELDFDPDDEESITKIWEKFRNEV